MNLRHVYLQAAASQQPLVALWALEVPSLLMVCQHFLIIELAITVEAPNLLSIPLLLTPHVDTSWLNRGLWGRGRRAQHVRSTAAEKNTLGTKRSKLHHGSFDNQTAACGAVQARVHVGRVCLVESMSSASSSMLALAEGVPSTLAVANAAAGAGADSASVPMTREERAAAVRQARFRQLDDASCLLDQSLAQDEDQPELAALLEHTSTQHKYWVEPYVTAPGSPSCFRPQVRTVVLGSGTFCLCDVYVCVCVQLLPSKPLHRLPKAIKDKYATCEVHTFMGLFPEIHRAFVVFDNRLMVWNYDHDDVDTTFDELDQVIVSVQLVVPRPDAFNDFVKVCCCHLLECPLHLNHLLCAFQFVLVIATSVQVVLLGVTFEGDDPANKMSLRPTHVEYSTDGVGMIQVRPVAVVCFCLLTDAELVVRSWAHLLDAFFWAALTDACTS